MGVNCSRPVGMSPPASPIQSGQEVPPTQSGPRPAIAGTASTAAKSTVAKYPPESSSLQAKLRAATPAASQRNAGRATEPLTSPPVLTGPLGEGENAYVHLGISAEKRVAVKTAKQGMSQELEREHQVLQFLEQNNGGHPNIIPCPQRHQVTLRGQQVPALSFKYLPNGTLKDGMRRLQDAFRNGVITPHQFVGIAQFLHARLTSAVSHLDSAKMVHLDLVSGNIMFDEEGEPVITDFAKARLPGERRQLVKHNVADVNNAIYALLTGREMSGQRKKLDLTAVASAIFTGAGELVPNKWKFEAADNRLIDDETAKQLLLQLLS